MNINVPLEIDDIVWVIRDRKACEITVTGIRQHKWNDIIKTVYHFKNYGDADIDFIYFKSEKDAEIEIARIILENLKDGE